MCMRRSTERFYGQAVMGKSFWRNKEPASETDKGLFHPKREEINLVHPGGQAALCIRHLAQSLSPSAWAPLPSPATARPWDQMGVFMSYEPWWHHYRALISHQAPPPPPRRSRESGMASVAVCCQGLLEGDTDLPELLGEGLEADAQWLRGPHGPLAGLPSLLSAWRPLAGAPLEGRLPREAQLQGWAGRRTSRCLGQVGEALPLSASASPSEAPGRGKLSQPLALHPHPR